MFWDDFWPGALVGGFLLPLVVAGFGGGFSWPVLVAGVVGGGLVVPVMGLWGATHRRKQAKQSRAAASQAAAQELERRAAENAQRAAQRAQAELARVQGLPSQVVSSYEAASQHAQEASRALNAAQKHRNAGAFTPFWEEIERGIIALNGYRLSLKRAGELSTDYDRSVRLLAPDMAVSVAQLPQELNAPAAHVAGSRLAQTFEGLVYDAQSDYHFAAIFEQRRTTAAVVDGFNSLTDAVSRMERSISDSVGTLTEAVRSAPNSKEDAFVLSLPQSTLGGQVVEINRNLETIARQLGS